MIQRDGFILTAVAMTLSCTSLFGDAGISSQASRRLLWFPGLGVWVSLGVCVLLCVSPLHQPGLLWKPELSEVCWPDVLPWGGLAALAAGGKIFTDSAKYG